MAIRFLAALLCLSFGASAQNATVFIQSISGAAVFDNLPATQTPLVQPPAVWVHPNGDIFVADGNFLVRRVRGGMSTIVAGGGALVDDSVPIPAKSANLDYPSALAGANSGELYITDVNHHRVRRLNTDGTMVTVAGRGTKGYSGDGGRGVFAELSIPRAIALSSTGDLFIADAGNYVVRKLNTATGVITTVAGTGERGNTGDAGQARNAKLGFLSAIAVDAGGNIYVADATFFVVRKIAPSG
ncbi:MAG: hypothetical protein ABIZ80_20710, partial [Bryobacteraceae bacterium]